MNRRDFVSGVFGSGSLIGLSGCIGRFNHGCETVDREVSDTVVSTVENVDGGSIWRHDYLCRDGDEVHFDIDGNGQNLEVEIVGTDGEVFFNGIDSSFSVVEDIEEGGTGEVRVHNVGDDEELTIMDSVERTDEFDSNSYRMYSFDLEEGDVINYSVESVSGSRPDVYIEDSGGSTIVSHTGEVEDEYVVDESGEYEVYIENTSSGLETFGYEVQFLREVASSSEISLEVVRKFMSEAEVC